MEHDINEAGCTCGANIKRNSKYDAFYCTASGVWLEKQCSDPKCEYCADRPETAPLMEDSD